MLLLLLNQKCLTPPLRPFFCAKQRHHRSSINKVRHPCVGKFSDRWREIDIGNEFSSFLPAANSRTTNKQRNVNVLFVRRQLACVQSMLAEMKSIVGGEDDV